MTSIRKPDNIFLIGPVGVGKTTIGRHISSELRLEFYDSDQEIELRTGADIPWIFDVEGEKGFRYREAVVIDELTRKSGIVLATGGGAVLCGKNRQCLVSRGVVVFLDTTVELQLKRTDKDKKRPLLQSDNRREVLENLREIRQPIYRDLADITVFVADSSSKKVVNNIITQMRQEGYLN